MTSGIRMAIAGAVIAGTTVYMGYVGAASSWKYYLTVDECVAASGTLDGTRLRVSGTVSPGSLAIDTAGANVTFFLAGVNAHLPVIYAGRLPDQMAESREVVVEGYLDEQQRLRADQVFTRCASKYSTPAEGTAGIESQAATHQES